MITETTNQQGVCEKIEITRFGKKSELIPLCHCFGILIVIFWSCTSHQVVAPWASWVAFLLHQTHVSLSRQLSVYNYAAFLDVFAIHPVASGSCKDIIVGMVVVGIAHSSWSKDTLTMTCQQQHIDSDMSTTAYNHTKHHHQQQATTNDKQQKPFSMVQSWKKMF